MSKLYIDVNQTNLVNVSRTLLQRSDLSMLQKLFLIEIADYQAQGKIPYLSQEAFAKVNDVNVKTVSRHLNKLYERGIIHNLGQVANGLACEFYLSESFMIEIGYIDTPSKYINPEPEEVNEETLPIEIVTSETPSTANSEAINYFLTDKLGRPFNSFAGYLREFNRLYPNHRETVDDLKIKWEATDNPF